MGRETVAIALHGAGRQGETIDSPAINCAIETAAEAGGGTVLRGGHCGVLATGTEDS